MNAPIKGKMLLNFNGFIDLKNLNLNFNTRELRFILIMELMPNTHRQIDPKVVLQCRMTGVKSVSKGFINH